MDRRAGLGEVPVSDRTSSVLMRVPPVSPVQEYIVLESDTYAAVRLAEAVGLLERVTVGREPEVDLGRGRAARDVVFDRLVGRFAGARAAVQVRLVVRDAGPGAGVVIGLDNVSSNRVSGI